MASREVAPRGQDGTAVDTAGHPVDAGGRDFHPREVWDLLVRRRWVVAAGVALALALGVAHLVFTTPVWESRASLRIEGEPRETLPSLDLLRSLSSAGSQLETEMEVLRSRTLAREVVSGLGLQLEVERPRRVSRAALLDDVRVDSRAPTGEYRLRRQDDGTFQLRGPGSTEEDIRVVPGEATTLPGLTFTLLPAAADHSNLRFRVLEPEEAADRVLGSLAITRPNREANVIRLRYESPDTFLVRAVPDLLIHRFTGWRVDVLKTGARSTVSFLQGQIDSLAVELTRAEEALQVYREGEQVVSLEAEKTAQVSQLAGLQAQRNQLDAERAALGRLVSDIEREIPPGQVEPAIPSPWRRIISFPSLLPVPAVSELLRSLNEVEAPLSDLLGRRTREDPDVQSLVRRIHELEEQLRSIALTYLEGLSNQVDELDRTLERFGRDLERIPARELQTARLARQASVLEEIYILLQGRLKEAEIAEAVEDATVQVVDPPVAGRVPVRPSAALSLVLAGVLGLLVGAGGAVGREMLDDTVHTREELETLTRGLPVIGMIPRMELYTNGRMARTNGKAPAGAHRLDGRVVTGKDPRNPVSEAYRALRTNLAFARPDEPIRTLALTSPMMQEGKSTVSSNLAVALAQTGMKVLLVDADLRRGVLHSVFGMPRGPGLSSLLVGAAGLAEASHRIELETGGVLGVIPTGPLPPNPAELLASERMRSLLQVFAEGADFVILDCPPLNVVTDAAILGPEVDGVLLVARASSTEKGALAYAADQLRRVQAPVLGTVLNDVDHRRDSRYSRLYGRYGSYHAEYYGEES